MILVPYFIDKQEHWIHLGVFLSDGGRSAWPLDSSDSKKILQILKENGFPVISLDHKDSSVYAKIDHLTLQLDQFYTWNEVDHKTSQEDVWRQFKIPVALWSCPVFKEKFWNKANLPHVINILDISI